MMKLIRGLLLLVGLPFLAHGGEALYHGLSNRQQVATTCDQLLRQRPAALWLRVSGCDIDYLGAGYRESNGHLVELFFPMRPPSQPPAFPVAMVLATSDPQALSVAEQIIGSNRQPDQETYLVTMLRVVSVLRASKEVEGYARSGVIERLQTRRALGGLTAPLAPDFIAIDLHAKPTLVRPGIEAGVGLLLLLVAVAWRRRAGVVPAVPAVTSFDGPRTDPEGVSETPAPAMPRRLPPVMLLNLEASAGTNDLEYAPAFGPRDEVKERIAGALGPLSSAAGGREQVSGADWMLAFDLGREEHVWAITAEARGGDGSIGALETLSLETGWRLFVPRLGTFVESSALGKLERPSGGSSTKTPALE